MKNLHLTGQRKTYNFFSKKALKYAAQEFNSFLSVLQVKIEKATGKGKYKLKGSEIGRESIR